MRQMGVTVEFTDEADPASSGDLPDTSRAPMLPPPSLGADGLPAGMSMAPAGVNTGTGAAG